MAHQLTRGKVRRRARRNLRYDGRQSSEQEHPYASWVTNKPGVQLHVALGPDTNEERIDEVVNFLEGVGHVLGVRIGSPSWEEES